MMTCDSARDCVKREGAMALSDSSPYLCVGCGADPVVLLRMLGELRPEAKRFRQTRDPDRAADRVREFAS